MTPQRRGRSVEHTHLPRTTASSAPSFMDGTQSKEFLTHLQKVDLTQMLLPHGQKSRIENHPSCGLSFWNWLSWAWILVPFSPQLNTLKSYSSLGRSEWGGREKDRRYFSQYCQNGEVLLCERNRMLKGGKIYLPLSTDIWSLKTSDLTIKFMLSRGRSPASNFMRQKSQYITVPLTSWDHELLRVPRSHATPQAKKLLLTQISIPN